MIDAMTKHGRKLVLCCGPYRNRLVSPTLITIWLYCVSMIECQSPILYGQFVYQLSNVCGMNRTACNIFAYIRAIIKTPIDLIQCKFIYSILFNRHNIYRNKGCCNWMGNAKGRWKTIMYTARS